MKKNITVSLLGSEITLTIEERDSERFNRILTRLKSEIKEAGALFNDFETTKIGLFVAITLMDRLIDLEQKNAENSEIKKVVSRIFTLLE